MKTVNGLIVSYLDLAENHNFGKVATYRDKTCKEIGKILNFDIFKNKTFKEIKNILDGEELEDLGKSLGYLSKYGALEQSENIGNQFEEESEIKVLDVDYIKIIGMLESLGAIPVFNGIIDDVYLDLPGNILENKKGYKLSFRIRYKMSKDGHFGLYYTLKRKKPTDINLKLPARICYEKEFEIKIPGMVIDKLDMLRLYPYRRKIKERIACKLDSRKLEGKKNNLKKNNGEVTNWIKFDIDLYYKIPGYDKIPPLLEIETDRLDLLPKILEVLGLKDKQISTSGSRGMQEKFYKIPKSAHLIQDSKTGLIAPRQAFHEHKKRQEEKYKILKN